MKKIIIYKWQEQLWIASTLTNLGIDSSCMLHSFRQFYIFWPWKRYNFICYKYLSNIYQVKPTAIYSMRLMLRSKIENDLTWLPPIPWHMTMPTFSPCFLPILSKHNADSLLRICKKKRNHPNQVTQEQIKFLQHRKQNQFGNNKLYFPAGINRGI